MYCPRKKTEVKNKDCEECICYIQKKDADEHLYMICNYENWYPSLKRGREWTEMQS